MPTEDFAYAHPEKKATGKNTKLVNATGVLPPRPLIAQNFTEFISVVSQHCASCLP
jgi:hypothetical protein